MARHRGVRNRQFSYDEGDEDYYDEDEEDRLVEEHRLQMLQARGEADDSRAGGSASGGISLSSYFDDLPGSAPRQQRQQQAHSGNTPPTHSNRHAPDKLHRPAGADDALDGDLVTAIATELESRLGQGRFSPEQIRQAVSSSGYEVDVAEAILQSTSEATATNSEPQVQSYTAAGGSVNRNGNGNSGEAGGGGGGSSGGSRGFAPPPGLPPDTATFDSSSPSSLAFGLCVGGIPGAAGGRAAASTTSGMSVSAAGGLERFGFDTPSPDDLNLFKQAAARGGGGGGSSSENNGGRKADAFSSPKAKVVHISGSTPKSTGNRKSVSGTPTPTKGRVQSPTGGGGASPSPQQSAAAAAAAAAIDESDDAQAGGKERLAMVVIGHVDAGKSTLMGQVLVQMGQVSQRALHKQEKEAREAGKASFFLAWVSEQ
ncbi:unnamed protein product, partial [Hapterophycus canaliculatus]